MNDVIKQLTRVKKASTKLAHLNNQTRNRVLSELAEQLRLSCQQLIQENQKDLALMDQNDPKYDRLALSETTIQAIANDVESVISLPSPLNNILEERLGPKGLRIQKIVVPLGVVAVIYESRPNVTIDVFSLCFKTGNACVLKGGKEAFYSNTFLVGLIRQVLQKHGIDDFACYLLEPAPDATSKLLSAVGLIDVCIPRGSQALIEFVREHAKIPVIETGAGIVHTYFDVSGDVEKGRLIINNAKTRRVSVCNALDTLIIHEKALSNLGKLTELLANKNIELFADQLAYQALNTIYPKKLLHLAQDSDFGREFLSSKMSIKTVSSLDEAVEHISHYSSKHSEAIITEEDAAAAYFLSQVDAAAVYVNASTAFTDGGQFGMGAEIGISTQKLHARGPMGLQALTSYKWLIWGNGQIRE